MTTDIKGNEKLHGHLVLQMLSEIEPMQSREQLMAEIHKNFGSDAVFYTCVHESLSAQSLVDFFEQKGKIVYGQTSSFGCNTSCD